MPNGTDFFELGKELGGRSGVQSAGQNIGNIVSALAKQQREKQKRQQTIEDAIALARAQAQAKQEFATVDPLKSQQAEFFERLIASQFPEQAVDTTAITDTGKEVGKPTVSKLPPGTSVNIGGFSIPLVPKPSAAQEKRIVETQELATGLSDLLSSFNRAKTAGKRDIPGFGARGPLGRFAGFLGKQAGQAGLAPEIDVFNAQREAFATTVAKAAGEVRPTDEDIRRFVKTLPSTARTDEENDLIEADIRKKIQRGEVADLWKSGAGGGKAFSATKEKAGLKGIFDDLLE